MRGITRDTLRELLDRKILYFLGGITVIAMLVTLSTMGMDLKIQIQQSGEQAANPMSNFVQKAAVGGLNAFLSVMVFLAVMASASVIPNMLEKGRAEYYLTKPISRAKLFLDKFLAIWVVYTGIVVVCALLEYITLASVHHIWDISLFYLFLGAVVEMFIWTAITVSAGVISGSTPIAIMAAFVIWVGQTIVKNHELFKDVMNSQILGYAVDGIYYVLPKTSQLSSLAEDLASGQPVDSWLPLYSSLLFAVAAVAAGTMVFRRKDY